MRSSTILLATAPVASAAWLRWTGNHGTDTIPRETLAAGDTTTGWTPKPTTPPGVEDAGTRVVLELLRRGTTSFLNSVTCGWFPSTSSAPFTCQVGFSCATNTANNVVGCVSGTFSPFQTSCLNYQAFKNGACSNAGISTGCCDNPDAGACGTFIWTGSPSQSLFRCFPTPTIVYINDRPQFVIDAATRTTSSSLASSSSPSALSRTASAASSVTPTVVPQPTDQTSGGNVGIGVIVGAAVGGLALLALLALLFCCCFLRRRKRASTQIKNIRKEDIRIYTNLPDDATGRRPPKLLHA